MHGDAVEKIILASGEEITAGQVISTAGLPATQRFMGKGDDLARIEEYSGRMSFCITTRRFGMILLKRTGRFLQPMDTDGATTSVGISWRIWCKD